jgi:hypothetical protein
MGAILCSAACGGRVTETTPPSPSATTAPTTSPSASGSAYLPAPNAVQYTANATAGGYDHVEIWKVDRAQDRCVHLHFVSPEKAEPGGRFASVEAPASWMLRDADRSKGAEGCKPNVGRGDVSLAADAKGKVTWTPPPSGPHPCRLSVHVTVSFDDAPKMESLDADDIKVEGAC